MMGTYPSHLIGALTENRNNDGGDLNFGRVRFSQNPSLKFERLDKVRPFFNILVIFIS
jgi:hypothetical protein